mmetsp:Transcript_34335/g.55062  ORF Transcript_34335/g.55062 Transcript_34335/m.55062 type:complete len:259 (+) Transcript_34335:62-838(+)
MARLSRFLLILRLFVPSHDMIRFHQFLELIKVDISISVLIHFLNHIKNLIFSQILSQRLHDRSQFLRRNLSISVFIKHFKRFLQLFYKRPTVLRLRVRVAFHHIHKLVDIHSAVVIVVNRAQHIDELFLREVVVEALEYVLQLRHCDLSIVVLVEETERHHKLASFLFVQTSECALCAAFGSTRIVGIEGGIVGEIDWCVASVGFVGGRGTAAAFGVLVLDCEVIGCVRFVFVGCCVGSCRSGLGRVIGVGVGAHGGH